MSKTKDQIAAEFRDGEARQWPFDDAQLEVIVSSWALHNINDRPGRKKAFPEKMRVLNPVGQVALLDIRPAYEYGQAFRDAGFENSRLHGPNFPFLIPSYWINGK